MSAHNYYNPEHERTCRGCYKKMRTKDGVLENKYKFTCPPCYDWYKKRNYWFWGIGIGVVILMILLYFWLLARKPLCRKCQKGIK